MAMLEIIASEGFKGLLPWKEAEKFITNPLSLQVAAFYGGMEIF
jgi:hypothetical protein